MSRSKSEPLSPIGLIEENLAEPLPVDEAQASPHPVPAGALHVAVAAGLAAASGAYNLAARDGRQLLEKARAEAQEARARARSAKKALVAHEAEQAEAIAFRRLVMALLGGRLRRTRFTVHKALWLTVAVVIGEVALNADAAISAGDPVVLSVISFLGIGAATVGIGLLGVLVRHAVDHLRYDEEAPPQAIASGLGHFYHPAGRLKAAVLGIGVVLLACLLALGLGVAALRLSGQSDPLYGLFTALTMVGATALAFWAEDPVADLLQKTDERIAQAGADVERQRQVVAEHRAAKARAKETATAVAAEMAASWDLALAAHLYGLARQPHAVGSYLPAEMVPLTHEEYMNGALRNHGGVKEGDKKKESTSASPTAGADATAANGSAPSVPRALGTVELPGKVSSTNGSAGATMGPGEPDGE